MIETWELWVLLGGLVACALTHLLAPAELLPGGRLQKKDEPKDED